jgi:hypothetical protein
MLDKQQKQVEEMTKFEDKIGGTVATLKEDIETPGSVVKSRKQKYADTKDTVVLGSLYGTRGKLERDKANEKGILGGITGVGDTQMFGPRITNEITIKDFDNPPPPPIEIKPCIQTAYGCI